MQTLIKTGLVSVLFCICSLGSIFGQIRSDFIVVEGRRLEPNMAFDSHGNLHMVMWSHDEGILYTLLDSLGHTIRVPKIISSGAFLHTPRLSIDKKHVVVAWKSSTIFGDGISGQLLTMQGDTVSTSVLFNQDSNSLSSPDVIFINDSTFLIIWSGSGSQTPDDGIYGQFATTSGRFVGKNVQFSDHALEDVNHGAVRVLRRPSNDDFIIIWIDDHQGTRRVYGRVFFLDGTPRDSSFAISENPEGTSAWTLSAAIQPNGRFAAVWTELKDTSFQVYWRQFQADGSPSGPSEKVNPTFDTGVNFFQVDIAIDQEGKSIVVWEGKENGVSKIIAQRFQADGTKFGPHFRISVAEPGFDQFAANVLLRNGKIYTAWNAIEDASAAKIFVWANILDFDNPTVRVEDQPEPVPTRFQLFQNYPNPFNPTTTISYEVSRQANMQLVIFNILGEEIITLIDEEVMPGTHQVVWEGKEANGSKVPSGVYLYQLRGGGFMQTKKMVLMQ